MISKIENLSEEQLSKIKETIGEAFVSNELFHNWGTEEQRHDDVMTYMAIFVEYTYRTGQLFSNEDMTGFIGLEYSRRKHIFSKIKMISRMLKKISKDKVQKLIAFTKQISDSNKKYAKKKHLNVLMVCVDKENQGKGIATDLVNFAKEKADKINAPLLFDTDMENYSEMYKYLGCELYNSVTADNGVTRYNLVYLPKNYKRRK